MLAQEQCERILAIMNNHSIEDKLKAIEEARIMFKDAFKPGMTDVEFAYSAMVVEQQYNYIREILQVKQIRIKADLSGHVAKEKVKAAKAATKPAKVNKYAFDPSKLTAAFAQFAQSGKGKDAETTATPNSNPTTP